MLEKYLEEASSLVDEEKRWAKTAQMTKWMFDNVAQIVLFKENAIWPVSLPIDDRLVMSGNISGVSNREEVPHRK